ncbi:galacturonokinase isoform X3 [Physcomitrium patens]|uniref:galacturonokinase isoform X3 n=1 Tax=Physcomitrium patens TaxID=3218 RepID=UPI000D15DEF9|nr:galacturonokinase-like isoform X3 [Physcomitrium patens]|eukprot:XP_024361591.1 galacturonokinase-like isoform X3 [Physcomitrella patens]
MVNMRLLSGQFFGEVRFSLDSVPPKKYNDGASNIKTDEYSMEEGAWGNFSRGAVLALQKKGYKLSQGITGFLEGSAGFEGCGVSSSAAVGVAFLLALESANGLKVTAEDNIELDRLFLSCLDSGLTIDLKCVILQNGLWLDFKMTLKLIKIRLIENEYLGLKNGILDQSAILLSQRHSLTAIHCERRMYELVQPPWYGKNEGDYKILLAFSGLQHALSSKPGYNLRVAECQEAATVLLRAVGRGDCEPLLCNVSVDEYEAHKDLLEGELAKRALHFFSENARVFAGIDAWSQGNLPEFGRLISQSGLSSIHNYECGCEPLVQLRDILAQAPGVYGARFSGAGFRGCCVALVATDLAGEAEKYVRAKYLNAQPDLAKRLTTATFVCDSADHAHVV